MKLSNQSVRVAQTEDEKRAIYEFRYQIYIEEMGKPNSHADHASKQLRDELDDQATLLYASRNGELTGTLRILSKHSEFGPKHFTRKLTSQKLTRLPPGGSISSSLR
jgi:hypothetical protein